MTQRAMVDFRQDEMGDWVARLACGHSQHVRHRPPFEERAWVTTTEGRSAKLGQSLDCLFCNMPALPADAIEYKRTRLFDETSIPAGLLRAHSTAKGVWGQIVVEEGKLLYALEETGESWVLSPAALGIIEPEQRHHVKPMGAVRFFVKFMNVGSAEA